MQELKPGDAEQLPRMTECSVRTSQPLKVLIIISVFYTQKYFKSLLSNTGQRSRIEFELLSMIANCYFNICIFSNVWYFLITKFDEFSSRFFIHVIVCYEHLKKMKYTLHETVHRYFCVLCVTVKPHFIFNKPLLCFYYFP